MGYTHYWTAPRYEYHEEEIKQALPTIKAIITDYSEILCYEDDTPEQDPVVNERLIRFNGKEGSGYETFYMTMNGDWNFCKTNRHAYDVVVCSVLLAIKAYVPSFEFNSDGEFDNELWLKARENVKEYGIMTEISSSGKLQVSLPFEGL